MTIIKTFYSIDKKERAYIHKREDGLFDVMSDSLEQDYYVDDDTNEVVNMKYFYWQENGVASCITDDISIAEEDIKRDFQYEYIEAPMVDEFDIVLLKDGTKGMVTDITEDGDYMIKPEGEKNKKLVSIMEIIESYD